jgi:hypothetical protein
VRVRLDGDEISIFDPNYREPPASTGVIATGGGVATGAGGVAIRGNVHGDINLGQRRKDQGNPGPVDDSDRAVEIKVPLGVLVEVKGINSLTMKAFR